MTDASEIYRRFVKTPLRLKSRTPSLSPLSPSPPSIQQYGVSNSSNLPAILTRSQEVKNLRHRVAKIRIFAADLDTKTQITPANDAEISTTKDSRCNKAETGIKTVVLKKKKRVIRSVSLKNEDTGADFMDTPTRALNPPKRSRKFSWDLRKKKKEKTNEEEENSNTFASNINGVESEENVREEEDISKTKTDSNNSLRRQKTVTVNLPLRRNQRLQHVTAESLKFAVEIQSLQQVRELSDKQRFQGVLPLAEQSELVKVATSMTRSDAVSENEEVPVATQTSVDLISTYCESLLSTNTISGCFFAQSWNALRNVEQLFLSKSTSDESDLFTICLGIAECEKIALCSFPSKASKLRSSKSLKPTKVKMVRPRQRSSGKIKLNTRKKSVRFRSFDLSCLDLQYVEDERVAVMVDKILTRYGIIMEHIEKVASQLDGETDTPVKMVLRELSRVMADPSVLYIGSRSSTDVIDASERIYQRAFGKRDPYSQHEIQICGECFARQFANLLVPRTSPSSPPQFLQSVFSSLASSSVRFKLRVLFIESEDFGEDVSGSDGLQSHVHKDEDGKPFPAIVPYEHQDLGAAIHWALQESVLYWPLVQPVHDMLVRGSVSSDGGMGDASPVMAYLEESAAEDLDHMAKYVLARRFLRFHLTKSRRRVKDDADAAETWRSIEKVCLLAKRLHFEDEAHLFPLASVDDFLTLLTHEESTLQLMEAALQQFCEQKYGMSSLQLEPCMECHCLITREETPTSIRCTTCARRFHLGCLHLPESFAQYAEHYTCPACFLGRGGY